MWKITVTILIVLTMTAIWSLETPIGHALPAYLTIANGYSFNSIAGNLTQTGSGGIYNNVSYTAATTILFDVSGIAGTPSLPIVTFTVNAYGNGTLTLRFHGLQPIGIVTGGSQSYSQANGWEQITYSSLLAKSSLVLVWGTGITTELRSVLFRDDFLYTNPLLESSWVIDQYTTPGTNSGEYTSSGYLVMKANSIGIETVHVTASMFNPSGYTTGTAVKRKMTTALIPFAKTETNNANIKTGFSALLTSGAYPSTGPFGTPFADTSNNCVSNGGVNDQVGTEYVGMDNSGAVTANTCGDGGNNKSILESGLNPSLYTVFTVVTYGVFCSTCSDNVYAGTGWVWFRVYQEDSTGKVIQSTDKNLNFTSNVAPLFQTNYAFVSQQNSNAGATGQLSKIDFVSVQNYGSPVCLVAPAGFLCSRLPPVPNSIIGNNGLVGIIAWLANQIGFGDEQLGAIILFFAMFFGAAFVPYYFSHNLPVGAFGAMLTLGFFTYVGFLPIWTLILVFLGGAAIVVQIVLRMLGGTSMGSFGGGDSGD